MRLEGRTAIITGGAKGIGAACALRFAQEDARVIVADVDEKAARETVDRIKAEGGEAMAVVCDVSDRLDVLNLVNSAAQAYGDIDILISNAGIIKGADFLDVEEEDFDRVLSINLKGTFLTGQAVARRMVQQIADKGMQARDVHYTIINMSSANAVLAIPNQVPYVVSKGGVQQLTKVMALSLAPHGIRVNAIGPGSIMTDVLGAVMTDDAARRKILSRTPMGRIGDPSEIAADPAFLASDDSSYMTGQTVYVDGGRMALNYTVPVPEACSLTARAAAR